MFKMEKEYKPKTKTKEIELEDGYYMLFELLNAINEKLKILTR